MRSFRLIAVLALIFAGTYASGCDGGDSIETEAPTATETSSSAIHATIAESFGSHLETATVRYSEFESGSSWDVAVELTSVPDDRSMDQYASEILATVASADESSTPIYLTVSADEFKPTWSEIEWGCLSYYWTDDVGSSTSRSDAVYLFHGEAEPPGGPAHGCMLQSRERGEWADVSIETLSNWADSGAPLIWGMLVRDD